MTEQQLRELLARHEADRVEFTISTNTDKLSEAVCAFANDLPKHGSPGYLIIGVDDAGRFVGMKVSDVLLRNLGGLRDDGNIQPLPAISVEKVVTSEGEAAVVAVQPAMLPLRQPLWARSTACTGSAGSERKPARRVCVRCRIRARHHPEASVKTIAFALKPADGAIGAHNEAVRRSYLDFHALAARIIERSGGVLR